MYSFTFILPQTGAPTWIALSGSQELYSCLCHDDPYLTCCGLLEWTVEGEFTGPGR